MVARAADLRGVKPRGSRTVGAGRHIMVADATSWVARRPAEARTVFVKGPKDKQYGDVVTVVDTIKGAGATKIGLQVDYLE